ncbi:MAG: hypothetical protein AAB730_01705 [Patescibacteria group bacterium]
MSELLSQLGINFKLLLSQGVNFFIVLAVLTVFVYRPLLKLLEERRKKIEIGLKGAEEVERRLAQIEVVKDAKLREGERAAFEIIKNAEERAGVRGGEILASAEKKAEDTLKKAREIEEQRRIEALSSLAAEARGLVREALAKTVSLNPEAVDEALIGGAVEELKRQKT